MKISPYLHIRRIEFMTTYFCPGRCKHCSVGGRLHPKEGDVHVRAKEAADAVKTLSRIFPVSSVMTFGGEPLLFPETVCAIHQTAASCGIPARQIITNGYFLKRGTTDTGGSAVAQKQRHKQSAPFCGRSIRKRFLWIPLSPLPKASKRQASLKYSSIPPGLLTGCIKTPIMKKRKGF